MGLGKKLGCGCGVLIVLLIVAAATGTLMIFPAVSAFLLSPFGEAHQKPALPTELAPVGPATDWQSVMRNAQGAFPSAAPHPAVKAHHRGPTVARRKSRLNSRDPVFRP